MKRLFCPNYFRLFFYFIFFYFFISCSNITNDKLIKGRWRLDKIKVYANGKETIFNLQENNYVDVLTGNYYFNYQNKAPLSFWYNDYNEQVINDNNGNLIGKIRPFRIDGDTIFLEWPKIFQPTLGKESSILIELLTEKEMITKSGWAIMNINPADEESKQEDTMYLSRLD